jgi:hypothetical protein
MLTTSIHVPAALRGLALSCLFATLLLFAAGCGNEAAEDVHSHDGEHGHGHDDEGSQPPPADVGTESAHGPSDGMLARFSRADEPDFGFLELKLHDDKGDLELWLARDRDITKPFDLPLDTVVTVTFLGDKETKKETKVELRARNKDKNEDEAGTANVRDGATQYFIFPGETGGDAAWLMGAAFKRVVRVSFSHEGTAYVSDDFELRPHGHGAGGHEHGDEDHEHK